MKLTSCDGCGVMLDADKLRFPEIRDDEGRIVDGAAVWTGDDFVAIVPCPVCGADIQQPA